jgi:predicted AlkP superfamily pyrophosphatase or phosphodiesterase
METTVFVYLDGCKYGTVDDHSAPFLFRMAREGLYRKSQAVPGFCERSAMLTGMYPETSGHLAKYRLDPSKSPFKWTRGMGFLTLVDKDPLKAALRYGIRTITRLRYGYVDPDPHYIPLRILHMFDIVDNKYQIEKELEGLPNLFSSCLQHGKNVAYFFPLFPFSTSDARIFNGLCKLLKSEERCDLIMAHFIDLDATGHKYGAESAQYRKNLSIVDRRLEYLYGLLSKKYSSVNLIIVSDHGMKKVLGGVNLLGSMRDRLSCKLGRDYIFFLDSTVARFWILNQRSHAPVASLLSSIPHGHVVGKREMSERRFLQNNRSYGDMMFWLDPGYVFCPDFFMRSESGLPVGMHGYLEEDEDLFGIFIMNLSRHFERGAQIDPVSLVDVFPTVLKILNLPVPTTCEGRSVI